MGGCSSVLRPDQPSFTVQTERAARAFSVEVEVAAGGRMVEHLATPGVPATTVIYSNDLIPATVTRMFVRTPDGAGGLLADVIEGVDAIRACFGLDHCVRRKDRMSTRPVDTNLLIDCARRFAELMGAPVPDEMHVRRAIDKVVEERRVVESAEMGLMTKDEAVSLLLAHFHSDLMSLAHGPTPEPWKDPALVIAVKRGLFGSD
jgi:hypothetical protein